MQRPAAYIGQHRTPHSQCSTVPPVSTMISRLSLFPLAALLSLVLGQAKYGPYRGPPVVPVILPGGFLADTREVAQAKEYHLNALAKAAKEVKATGSGGNKGYYNVLPRAYLQSQTPYQQQQQQQPLFQVPVARPKPQAQPQPLFQPAARPAPVYEGQQDYDDPQYQEAPVPRRYQYISSTPRPDPQVTPVILENGYIADTAEVDAAKAEHFAAVAKAQEAVARALEAAAQKHPSGYQAAAAGPSRYSDAQAAHAPGPQRYTDY